jgi:microcystin-dependent protein
MSQQFIGEIRLFPYDFAPSSWAYCAGQLLNIAQNQRLFALIGTTYGGNGTTDFALPDMRGRALIHSGTGRGATYSPGQQGGLESVTLVPDQIPSHSHLWQVTRKTGDKASPASNYFAGGRSNQQPAAAYAAELTNPVLMAATTIGPGGESRPHTNMQPYLALAYCIALQGAVPTRN